MLLHNASALQTAARFEEQRCSSCVHAGARSRPAWHAPDARAALFGWRTVHAGVSLMPQDIDVSPWWFREELGPGEDAVDTSPIVHVAGFPYAQTLHHEYDTPAAQACPRPPRRRSTRPALLCCRCTVGDLALVGPATSCAALTSTAATTMQSTAPVRDGGRQVNVRDAQHEGRRSAFPTERRTTGRTACCTRRNARRAQLCTGAHASAPSRVQVLRPSFVAPERQRAGDAPETLQASEATDCWNLGVLLFLLLTGEMPFTLATERKQKHLPRIRMRVCQVRLSRGCMQSACTP